MLPMTSRVALRNSVSGVSSLLQSTFSSSIYKFNTEKSVQKTLFHTSTTQNEIVAGGIYTPSSGNIKAQLDQIMKVGKAEQEKTPQEISDLWHGYHYFQLDLFGDVITADKFNVFYQRYRQCRHFVLPVFKNIGYMNVFIQFQHPFILVTSLREYKSKHMEAPIQASIVHYTDFIKTKGIVLMRGEVTKKQDVNKGDALEIVRMLYHFYCTDSLYYGFVEPFNKTPALFDYNKFLETYKLENPKDPTKRIITDKNELDRHKYQKEKLLDETHFKDLFYGKYRTDIPSDEEVKKQEHSNVLKAKE